MDISKNSPELLIILGQSSHQIVPLARSDSFCSVSHAYQNSFASNLPAYNDLEDVIPYLRTTERQDTISVHAQIIIVLIAQKVAIN